MNAAALKAVDRGSPGPWVRIPPPPFASPAEVPHSKTSGKGEERPPSCLVLAVATRSRTADAVIARIARTQHGVVTRSQLRAAGLTNNEIHGRLSRGGLIAIFPGVFRAGHAAPSMLATYMAAVLACGDGALLRGGGCDRE